MSGGYYKQEQTPGGYQDALKIHNHSSQRIEKTNNWYKNHWFFHENLRFFHDNCRFFKGFEISTKEREGWGVLCILILYRTGTYGSLVL